MIFGKFDIKSDGGCDKWSFFKWKFKFCYKFSQTPKDFVHNLPVGQNIDFQSRTYFISPLLGVLLNFRLILDQNQMFSRSNPDELRVLSARL